jgi:hypothetical protein
MHKNKTMKSLKDAQKAFLKSFKLNKSKQVNPKQRMEQDFSLGSKHE